MTGPPPWLVADLAGWTPLVGHSGQYVLIATFDGKDHFVRKSSRDPNGSERLRSQCHRQESFSASTGGLMKTPEVLRTFNHEGCFGFDMQFVDGQSLAARLSEGSFSELQRLADLLVATISTLSQSSAIAKSSDKLVEALGLKVLAVANTWFSEDCEILNELIQDQQGLGQVLPTACHGDMTLENLIVDRQGQLWAIDLLDPPFEHVWFDVSKLHQDLEGEWFRRHGLDIGRASRLFISRQLIRAIEGLSPGYERWHEILLAVTFLRVIPYSQNEMVRQMAIERVRHYISVAKSKGV